MMLKQSSCVRSLLDDVTFVESVQDIQQFVTIGFEHTLEAHAIRKQLKTYKMSESNDLDDEMWLKRMTRDYLRERQAELSEYVAYFATHAARCLYKQLKQMVKEKASEHKPEDNESEGEAHDVDIDPHLNY
jgi:acyl-[acyl carrier protein]--UDP-N-acetylglucosamine O-acyltransferase